MTPSDLPERVIVDQHGHYWRDYGDHYSMCPVSDENVATEVAAVYLPREPRVTKGPLLTAAHVFDSTAEHPVWVVSQENAHRWGDALVMEQLLVRNAEIAAYREALQWCSGSADFAPGGKAREGWLRIAQPLLDAK